MGSWFGTCGITQLPLVDEEVVMVPLKLSNTGARHGGDHVYQHDIWTPNGIPVYGKYYDYGEMCMLDGQQRIHDANVGVISHNLIERPHVDEYDPEITEESIHDIETYQAAIHSGRLAVNQRNYASDAAEMIEAAVGRMLINRTVWDELVQNGPAPRWKGDTTIYNKEYYRAGIVTICDPNLSAAQNDIALEVLHNGTLSIRSVVFDVRRQANNLSGKIRDAFVAQFADQLAELYVIDNMMMQLRKTWMPQAGAGSQASDYHAYNVLLSGMRTAMQQTIARRRADGWYDEEEE
jgi:hypothetical protein